MFGRLVRAICLVAFVTLLDWPARGQGPCGIDFPHDANPTPITDDDICNFHRVEPDFYRGGRPRPSAFPKLVKLGIRTIMDLEGSANAEREQAAIEELNRKLPAEQRLEFIAFPIEQNEIELAGVSHERMQSLLRQVQQAKRPVFVHCYLGRDRVGLVVALHRILQGQMTYDEALEEAVRYKFNADDSPLKRTLDRYKSPKKLQSLLRP
jgi:protein tyrosine/serine phosphatase